MSRRGLLFGAAATAGLTMSGLAVPTSASGAALTTVTPGMADRVVDSFGVVLHPSWADTPYADFDDFLREESLYVEAQAIAVKRVLAYELGRGMVKAQLTKTAMAKRMGTTRAQLDRLLNPDNPATTLQTLVRAAGAVGKRVKISLVNA